MEPIKHNQHTHIEEFNPDVKILHDSYQDFFCQMKEFNAGVEYQNFSDFVINEASEYAASGDGVTYIVWNVFSDTNGRELRRDMVAFYTLGVTAIPYEDRIRLDEEEAYTTGQTYDIQNCGIPAVELKMFAVSEKYQNVFFRYQDEDMPIAAWILKSIINTVEEMSKTLIGCKAIFLHAVPKAVDFYLRNGFQFLMINMTPFYSFDAEFTPMFLALYELHINYDD